MFAIGAAVHMGMTVIPVWVSMACTVWSGVKVVVRVLDAHLYNEALPPWWRNVQVRIDRRRIYSNAPVQKGVVFHRC